MKSPSPTQQRVLDTADSNGKVSLPEGIDRRTLNALIKSGHVEYRNELVRGIPALVPYVIS